ncbi:proline--tRNA ligase [Buchnera aphidicola]|uniref:Proline--tRNA ligase n=1 Tax=Buchnera aphidicola (Anoecia oenotherae) TaxID=1241833 RepID=A0A4D6XRB1_9GAMM|nr:proline--tRNA ligase [Buchnera aphidicola]QCI19316.1 proline--tRNA ligase [Buchnera aphidicola (Anoecia oenotherae)]
MKTSNYLLYTLKTISNQTDTISNQLMLRAGIIRKISSGLYTWLPTGMRVIKKIQTIIQKELNKTNAIEISMPILQPSKIWENSGRIKTYGKELLKIHDRRNKMFILSPTHEELITLLLKKEINSYKQLPIILYQTQTKFRDEIRPRFGTIRTREFLMKDAYSFHLKSSCLDKTYKIMYKIYSKIFKSMNINFKIVEASSNNMGGNISHEFQAISSSGEDKIVFSNNSNYASNIEIAAIKNNLNNLLDIDENNYLLKNKIFFKKLNRICIQKINHYSIPNLVNTFIAKYYSGKKLSFIALLIKKNRQLNLTKIKNLTLFSSPITLATQKEIFKLTGQNDLNVIGPIGLTIPIISDIEVAKMKNFSVKANAKNYFFTGVNWIRDLKKPYIEDIRNIEKDDNNPDNTTEKITISPSIEIAHIFKIGSIYSKKINFSIKNKDKKDVFLKMGCYGIGITRLIATIIEQHHDKYGIIWPNSIAPFHVALIPINFHKSTTVKKTSNHMYDELKKNNIDTILDNRKEYLGKMFSEIELIGIPHILILKKNHILKGKIEYKNRREKNNILIPIKNVIDFIKQQMV